MNRTLTERYPRSYPDRVDGLRVPGVEVSIEDENLKAQMYVHRDLSGGRHEWDSIGER